MKNNVVKVTLWDITVGYLKWNDDNWKTTTSIFQFDKKFRESGLNIAPLEMPLESLYVQNCIPFTNGNPKGTFKGLPRFIADSLPDHWGTRIFNAWAKDHLKGDKTTPVDILSFIGMRGMGALEFMPSAIVNENIPFDVDVNKLYKFAKQILSERIEPEFSADKELLWQDLVKLGTSPGGKRPKALIAINEKENKIKSGQTILPDGYKYYILKYDNETDSFPYARMEYAYYLLSKDAGIAMTPCFIRKFDNATHFITERFDRIDQTKVHMLSLRAMANECTSYEKAFDTILRLKLNYKDVEQLFRRMVFNVLAGNIDDHDGNFSFLMDKTGTWSLSPAYDIIYSIDPSASDFSKGQFMSINGKADEINKKDILLVAQRYGIRNPERIIENITDAIIKLDGLMNDLDIPNITQKQVKKELNNKYNHFSNKTTVLFTESDISDGNLGVKTIFEQETINKIKLFFNQGTIEFKPIKRLMTKGQLTGSLFRITVNNKHYTFVSDNQTKDICYCSGFAIQGKFYDNLPWTTINGKPAGYTPTRVLSMENKKKLGLP